MKKTYYKVLLKPLDVGRFLSFTGPALGVYCVEYKIDEFVYPDKYCGPLAVFPTRKHAVDFLVFNCEDRWGRISSEYVVYECEIIQSDRHTLHCCGMQYDNVPIGTVFADAVKITKEVRLPPEMR